MKLRPASSECSCGGRRFQRDADGFVCLACGEGMAAREVRPTKLVAATCRRCSGPFLWRRPVESGIPRTAPLYCRACQAENQADFYARRVRELREQAVTLRASQKRAFARWRPPLSQAEAQKHNGERV